MKRLLLLLAGTAGLAAAAFAPTPSETPVVATPVVQAAPTPSPTPEPYQRTVADDAMWDAAAGTAWKYVQARTTATTGLAPSTVEYPFVTAWDIGSTLGAVFSAHHLGIVPRADYERRMGRLLRTLERLPLYEDAAFNKSYSVRGSRMNKGNEGVGTGYGWSAIDVGRLLVWLHIVATGDPAFAPAARRIVDRLDAERLTEDGYMRGASLDRQGRPFEYQEGKVGYEQYAARGFDAWGMPVAHALDVSRHGVPATFGGHTILVDDRGHDRLTSEAVVLGGIELGWADAERRLADAVRGLQDDRWRRTGQVTMVSEDASNTPPHFFYYYTVYAYGTLFPVVVHDPDAMLDGPRWVSAKAAFAWEALRPSEHSRSALDLLAKARTAAGWAVGVDEGTGTVTGPVNLNTQAVILESALYRKHGRPLLEVARDAARTRVRPPAAEQR